VSWLLAEAVISEYLVACMLEANNREKQTRQDSHHICFNLIVVGMSVVFYKELAVEGCDGSDGSRADKGQQTKGK
jgi:hypothetical protein